MAKTLRLGSAPLAGGIRLDQSKVSIPDSGDFDFDAFHRVSSEDSASSMKSTDPLLKLDPAPQRPNEVRRISNTLLGIEDVDASEAPARIATEFDDRLRIACAETEWVKPATDEFAPPTQLTPDEFGNLDFDAFDFTDENLPPVADNVPKRLPEVASVDLFNAMLRDVLEDCYPITIAELVRRIRSDDSLGSLQIADPYLIAGEAREVFNYEILPKVNDLFDRIKGGVLDADKMVAVAPTLAAHAEPRVGAKRQSRVVLNKTIEVLLFAGVTATLQVYRNPKKLFESERQPDALAELQNDEPTPPLIAQSTPGLPRTAPAIPKNVDREAGEPGKKVYKPFVETDTVPSSLLVKLPATELLVTFSVPILRVTVPNLNVAKGEPPTLTILYRHLIISNDIHDGLVRDAAYERQKRIRRNFAIDDTHNDGTVKKPYPHLELLLLDPTMVKAMSTVDPEVVKGQSAPLQSPTNVLFIHQNFKAGVSRRDAQIMYVITNALNAALQKA